MNDLLGTGGDVPRRRWDLQRDYPGQSRQYALVGFTLATDRLSAGALPPLWMIIRQLASAPGDALETRSHRLAPTTIGSADQYLPLVKLLPDLSNQSFDGTFVYGNRRL